MIEGAVLVLAVFGMILSGFLMLVATGAVSGQSVKLPKVCRISEHSCSAVLKSPDARLFGLPNVLVGLGYYGALIVLAVEGNALMDLMGFLVLLGAFTVVTGIYLTLRLVLVHRVQCAVCLSTHIINLLLFGIFLAGL